MDSVIVVTESEPNLEAEVDPEAELKTAVDILDRLDSDSLLNLVSGRLFDHFSTWDLIMAKSRQKVDVKNGMVHAIVDDIAIVLEELRCFIEGTLNPLHVDKSVVKRKTLNSIELDELLMQALGLDTKIWVKKNVADIEYKHDHFNPTQMFSRKLDDEPMDIKVETTEDKSTVKEKKVSQANKENEYESPTEEMPDSDADPEFILPSTTKIKKSPTKRRKKIKQEVNSEEKAAQTFECLKCHKIFKTQTAWYKHIEKVCGARTALKVVIKTIKDEHFCTFEDCPKSQVPFKTKDEVHDHWSLYHATDDQKFIPCPECPEHFATFFAHKLHLGTAHVKKEEPLLEDSNQVKRKRKPQDYTDEQRGSKEKYLCLKCGASMTRETGVKHEAKCTGLYLRKPEYKKIGDEIFCTVAGCNIGHSFNSMYGMRKHFHTVHTREEEKIFACEFCDEKFSFKTARNLHITEKHKKGHVCDFCGKGFGGRSKMLSHRLLHTGEKPFACDRCDYRAVKKCNYESHMESKHGVFTQKNFLCGICNKQFVTMGRVRRHLNEMHGKLDDSESNSRKKRRNKKAPPVEKQVPKKEIKNIKRVGPVGQSEVIQTHQLSPAVIQTNQGYEEQETAVQYIQAELGHGDERVITIRPLN